MDISIANKNEVKIQRGKLLITHKLTSNPQRVLDLWYKEKATLYFDKIVDESLMLFVKYNIEKPGIQIKKMQKRWGSCSIKGKIILNLELIKAPKGSIEYVIIHELCHLIHHNHTKAFYDLQERTMHDWKKWKVKLEKSMI
ncbi:SprT-like family protein [compost metagenome]